MLLTKRLSCLLELPRAYFARCCAVLSRFSRVWLHNPMECSLPGSSAHGILQAKILEWVAVSSSGDLPDPGIKLTSLTSPALLYHSTTWEAPLLVRWSSYIAHLMLTATFWDGAFVLSFYFIFYYYFFCTFILNRLENCASWEVKWFGAGNAATWWQGRGRPSLPGGDFCIWPQPPPTLVTTVLDIHTSIPLANIHSACYMPGIVPSALYMWTHLNFRATVCFYSHS